MTGGTLPFPGLGAALVLLRKRHGMRQHEVAAAAGVTRAQLSRYESGRGLPNLATLGRILAAIGCDLGDLQDALSVAEGPAPAEARTAAAAGPGVPGLRDGEIAELSWRLLGLLRERATSPPLE